MIKLFRSKIRIVSVLRLKPITKQPCIYQSIQARSICSSSKMSSSSSNNPDFTSMKVLDLKKFLGKNGLPKDGCKKVLLERAQKYWNITMRSKSDSIDTGEENNSNQKEVDKVSAASEQALEPVTVPAEANISTPNDWNKLQDVKTENTDIKEENTDEKMENLTVEKVIDTTLREAIEPNKRLKRPRDQRLKSKFPFKKPKISAQNKTPLQVLNERVQGLKPELITSYGTANNPTYVMKIVMNGQDFIGEGSSKKLAKQVAAQKAVQSLELYNFGPLLPPPMFYQVPPDLDFTSDDPVWEVRSERPLETHTQDSIQAPPDATTPTAPPPHSKLFTDLEEFKRKHSKTFSSSPEDKHPVMLLNELVPGLQYVDEGMNSQSSFTVKAIVNGVEYKGEGRNKKLARMALAVKAVKDQFNISCKLGPKQSPVLGDNMKMQEGADVGNIPELVKDLISNKFQELTDNYNSPYSKNKVLAGIVMTRDNGPDVEKGEVICVATGTKCISGEHLSNTGSSLFDCHAEIVCRRALRRFLYMQLLLHSRNPVESIFEPSKGSEGTNGGYRLKSNVFFHLYISTSPCGDSRIFSPHETQDQNDEHPNRKARGLLRTKIEAGEGTIPIVDDSCVNYDGVQPWDSVLGGERLLTMSCSDKLARWNLLGLQGSLLSLYMEPVYLSSIILGSLYHNDHFVRGVYTRIKDALIAGKSSQNGQTTEVEVDTLVTKPFRLNKPMLASVNVPEQRKLNKAPSFCFHWTAGDDQSTIINTVTGKSDEGDPSNLSKMEMFKLFHDAASLKGLMPKMSFPDDLQSKSYAQIKRLATEYQELKNNLNLGLKAANLGMWIKKPREVDEFYLQAKIK